MLSRSLALFLAIALTSGCATNSRRVRLANDAALAAENHGLWTRPTEVGFKMGEEISATAVSTRVLGFNVGESKNGINLLGLAVVAGGVTGAALSPTGQFAAYKAVADAEAEGIYVTRVETNSNGFLFFWKHENVTVYGRALELTDYGPVDEDRADRWRFRNYGPKTMVIKEGDADVNVSVPADR